MGATRAALILFGTMATVTLAAVDYLDRTIAPPESGRVPNPLRQGEFLSPQSVSALAISPDPPEAGQLAVTTMAFRHGRNFWLPADGCFSPATSAFRGATTSSIAAGATCRKPVRSWKSFASVSCPLCPRLSSPGTTSIPTGSSIGKTSSV